MGQAKEQFIINGEIGELFRKLDMESSDLMRFYDEEKVDIEYDLHQYMSTLPDDLSETFFDEKDYYDKYKEVKDHEKEKEQKQLALQTDVQPVIYTADVDFVLKMTGLEDTRKNRWIIAYLGRTYDRFDTVAAVELAMTNWNNPMEQIINN